WPPAGVVTQSCLAQKSEGIFAYASTPAKFINNKYGDPCHNLKIVKHTHKGLDSLYVQVLQDAKNHPNFAMFIGTFALLCESLPILAFPPLLQLKSVEDMHLALHGYLSVMTVPDDAQSSIRP
ncbi:hypothetical protein C8J56DRAFT_787051, partial [Mycena floridula]